MPAAMVHRGSASPREDAARTGTTPARGRGSGRRRRHGRRHGAGDDGGGGSTVARGRSRRLDDDGATGGRLENFAMRARREILGILCSVEGNGDEPFGTFVLDMGQMRDAL